MGIDARIAMRFDPVPSQARIKELQFHLMHRFDHDVFWTRTLADCGGWVVQDFIQPITDGNYYFDSDFDATGMWSVEVYCRYWGDGYERGPGLTLAGILYYLAGQPDVKEVRYGGDSSGTDGKLFTQNTAIAMFEEFCEKGNLPYQSYFDRPDHRRRDEPDRPTCSYCELPMMRNGFGGKYARFYCAGCGESLSLRDAAFDAWMQGRPFEGERKSAIREAAAR